ncbi:hypothetical protein V2H45_07980 [Tumidithrix elongata RA019]|uniref:VanZ-like domain-containing protein n=1 Tax=Tumidithrix elongata BACA0141 TaxID=2716417 RepID=A0AAW9PZS5_9CYAN|nr:hypothetical protein [Tumidithrix elongata RA019]
MSAKSKKRPLVITILSALMIGLSLWLIAFRSYLLRTSPVISDLPDTGEGVINLKLISGISIVVGIGFIPLLLGIGLWRLLPWARAISICLFSSFLFPCLAAAIGLVQDPVFNRTNDLAIATGCAVVLAILLNPKISKTFASNKYAKSIAEE